jgi:mRNA-degrading endonuclease RelE of RelBE toxin-antitoxin system
MAAVIVYSPEALDHLAKLRRNEQVGILDAVDKLLSDQPTLPSRKRKYLRPNAIAQWELRWGDLRVFYDVSTDQTAADTENVEQATVTVKAVGKKVHNELWIGGAKI